MGLPVLTDYPRAVNKQSHREAAYRNIVNHLVKATLKKRGVNHKKRLHSCTCKACRKGYGVLFCNAHVKKSVFILSRKGGKSRSRGHCGGYSADFRVFFGKGTERRACNIRKCNLAAVCRSLFNIKGRDAVIAFRRGLGVGISLALGSYNMNQRGTRIGFSNIEKLFHGLNIMPVYRS